MTTLSALLHHVQTSIEKHGPDSPCYYSLWDVDVLQEWERGEHEMAIVVHKSDPEDMEDPGEFVPLTEAQLKYVAEYMMEHDNPNKQWQAFVEAHSFMPNK